MSLECRIGERFPVAVASLSGTLDDVTVVDVIVTLRTVLAEQPVALVLDLAPLRAVDAPAWRALTNLARDARRWPGARLVIGDANPAIHHAAAQHAHPDGLQLSGSTDEAFATAVHLPVPPNVVLTLPAHHDSPAISRGAVARACRRWGLQRWQRLAQLLASELVTNAVVHAQTQSWFILRHLDQVLQVAVRDCDPRLVTRPPLDQHQLLEGDPGRGLLLLETLADDWGCTPTGDGKVTWANLALTLTGQRP
jgi:anti-sigma regulatory factor (Ser/Thr protein kinase)